VGVQGALTVAVGIERLEGGQQLFIGGRVVSHRLG